MKEIYLETLTDDFDFSISHVIVKDNIVPKKCVKKGQMYRTFQEDSVNLALRVQELWNYRVEDRCPAIDPKVSCEYSIVHPFRVVEWFNGHLCNSELVK